MSISATSSSRTTSMVSTPRCKSDFREAPMKNLTLAWALAALIGSAIPAQADDSLFQALGGKDGINRIVAESMVYYLADPRIKDTFAESNNERVEAMLEEQFCALTGGPCTYT